MRAEPIYLVMLVVISLLCSGSQLLMRWGGALSAKAPELATGSAQWLWNARWWLLGLGLGWVCGLAWAFCLRKVPLALALPIYSGLTYVLTAIGAVWLLKEKLAPVQAVGITAVLFGILLLSFAPAVPQR
jgi:multidrug transporter EmrE-like cation transporter